MATMMQSLLMIVILFFLPFIHAQIRYDFKTSRFQCPSPNATYCTAESHRGSSIISCGPDRAAEMRSCHVELSGIVPLEYKGAAVCYEASARSGNAVCAFNGTGYTPSGLEMYIPETVLCDDILPIPPSNDEMDEEAEKASRRQDESQLEISASDETSIRSNSSADSKSAIPTQHDIALQNLPRPAMLPSTPLPAPSDVRDHNNPICSNPWTGDTRTGDRMTLDIVLVVPTPRIEVADTQSQPLSSSAEWATQSANASSSMNSSESVDIHSSSVTPTPATGVYSVTSVGGQGGGTSTWNSSGVLGTDSSNGVEYVNLKTVIVVGIFTLILWACVFLQCF